MSDPIPGRAATPEQKRAIIERLLALWLVHPTQRLGQLLDNAHAGPLLYYVEDEALIELIEMSVVEHKHEPGRYKQG